MNKEQRTALAREMADRLMAWKLPEAFNPDGGISFKRESDFDHPEFGRTKYAPTGTNLFTHEQAVQMFLDVLPEHDAREQRDELLELLKAISESAVYIRNGECSVSMAIVRRVDAAIAPASPQAGEVERLRAECDQITDLNHAQWLALGKAALLVAACNRLSEEAEEYDFDDGLGRGVQQAYWDEFEQALEHAIEAMDEANKTTARLHANPAQAGEVNEWKEAVLEQLAAHSMDAPIDEPPAKILRRIINMACSMATDPAINTPAQMDAASGAEGPLNDEQRIGWCVWRIKDLEGQLTAARAAAPQQPQAQPDAGGQVPEGWALVSLKQLAEWKNRVNTLATLSLKADRYEIGRAIKTEIADVIEVPVPPGLAPTPKPQAQPESAGDSVDAAPIIAAYQITEGMNGIKVERVQQIKGPAKWAVRCNGNVLSVQGEWDWEPMPSSRDDDWLEKFRFDNAQDAIDAARTRGEGSAS